MDGSGFQIEQLVAEGEDGSNFDQPLDNANQDCPSWENLYNVRNQTNHSFRLDELQTIYILYFHI